MRVFVFIKKAVKAYVRMTAESYPIRCTGDIFIPTP